MWLCVLAVCKRKCCQNCRAQSANTERTIQTKSFKWQVTREDSIACNTALITYLSQSCGNATPPVTPKPEARLEERGAQVFRTTVVAGVKQFNTSLNLNLTSFNFHLLCYSVSFTLRILFCRNQ